MMMVLKMKTSGNAILFLSSALHAHMYVKSRSRLCVLLTSLRWDHVLEVMRLVEKDGVLSPTQVGMHIQDITYPSLIRKISHTSVCALGSRASGRKGHSDPQHEPQSPPKGRVEVHHQNAPGKPCSVWLVDYCTQYGPLCCAVLG
jgi:hypothetical protein